MSNVTARRLAVAALVLVLPLAGVACGSDDDDTATPTTEQGAAPSDDTGDDAGAVDPTDDAGTDPGTDDPGSEEPATEGECADDPDNLSGSSTVLFYADVEVSSGQLMDDVAPEHTMVIGADGTAQPSALEVPVDTLFAVMTAEDASLTAFVVGCATGQTAMPGTPAGFLITAPGTYVVFDELADVEVGTIVVQ